MAKIDSTNYNQTPIITDFRITKDLAYWTTMFNDFVDAYIDDAKVSKVQFSTDGIYYYKDSTKHRFNQYAFFSSKAEVLGYVKGLIDAKNIADRKKANRK